MRNEKWLRKSKQYYAVYAKGRSWANSQLVMKASPNNLAFVRFGISTSRGVGNAVTRNRVKRMLREIFREQEITCGMDIVFIARTASCVADYQRLSRATRDLLSRAGLLNINGKPSLSIEAGENCKTKVNL
jgi:ribonuclease P protein component